MNLNELKCIKVTHETGEGETLVSYISFNQFKTSFINEKWEGEKRYDKNYTLFGYVHTKTIVTNPFNGKKSIRKFEFPRTHEEAENIHKEAEK